MTIMRIGLDTAKHVFQVHGVDENEETVVRRQLRRSEMGKFFNRLAPTRIGFRMPARRDLSARAEGRRPKASQEGTRGPLGGRLPSMGI